MQNQLDVLIPQWPAPGHVRAAMTTRSGGVSSAPWTSLNLGDHVGDAPDRVAINRRRLAYRLGAQPVFLKQIHGTDVLDLDDGANDGDVADASITSRQLLACTMMVADCLPVLLTDTKGQAVAAAHAGWRGLAGGILEQTVARLCSKSSADPDQLLAWLGPCIGPTAFEVGDDVRQAFVVGCPDLMSHFEQKGEKWLANLPALARDRLIHAGLVPANVYGNDGSQPWCTVSNVQRFFSHRRDAAVLGTTGRMAASIWLA